MSKPSTLESRIATALTATDIKSSNLATLIAETESAITTADKTAEEERTKALDPIASPDATKAREAMQAAEFSRDRLRTVLPRLQAKHKEVKEQEHAAAWTADYAAVKAKRDVAAEQLREGYPTIALPSQPKLRSPCRIPHGAAAHVPRAFLRQPGEVAAPGGLDLAQRVAEGVA